MFKIILKRKFKIKLMRMLESKIANQINYFQGFPIAVWQTTIGLIAIGNQATRTAIRPHIHTTDPTIHYQ